MPKTFGQLAVWQFAVGFAAIVILFIVGGNAAMAASEEN